MDGFVYCPFLGDECRDDCALLLQQDTTDKNTGEKVRISMCALTFFAGVRRASEAMMHILMPNLKVERRGPDGLGDR